MKWKTCSRVPEVGLFDHVSSAKVASKVKLGRLNLLALSSSASPLAATGKLGLVTAAPRGEASATVSAGSSSATTAPSCRP
jgi:hypothetical protein